MFERVNMEAVIMFLSVLFVPGVLGACPTAHLFITAPQKIEALTGSCVLIPCSFRLKENEMLNSREKVSGVWIKGVSKFSNNPNNVIFNGTKNQNIYRGEITGNLREENCTTVFYDVNTNYNDRYFFRIESRSFRATASCDSVDVRVTDSPPRPALEIPGDLKEAEPVTLTCSAPTPCPDSAPRLTWNLQQNPLNELETHANGTFMTRIRQTFTVSDRDDGRSVSCSATYPVDGGQKTADVNVTLSVSYAPKDTVVSISGSEGDQVNMTCSSRANPPVRRFSWFKKNLDKEQEVSEGTQLSVTLTDGDVYFCEVVNSVGQQRSAEIQLREEKTLPWEPIVGGISGFVFLVCFVVIALCCLTSKRPTIQQTQSPAGGDHIDPRSDGENIHYGEIDFSKRTNETSSSQDIGQQQDTVYAQVKVSMSTEDVEDLYAQVKKK